MSPNGVAVGTWTTSDKDLVWDRIHGARQLKEILANYGVQLPPGTRIWSCLDISADERVIMGLSYDSRGDKHVFRAVLPAGAFE